MRFVTTPFAANALLSANSLFDESDKIALLITTHVEPYSLRDWEVKEISHVALESMLGEIHSALSRFERCCEVQDQKANEESLRFRHRKSF